MLTRRHSSTETVRQFLGQAPETNGPDPVSDIGALVFCTSNPWMYTSYITAIY